ncbi:TetR/AcrR family transcriptional regulator [Actinokineospora guangxiensis]|uniref:TetR/AcrR family transcriptional regulator n=1 Tax=Actinokineospora guangxiensis TaxID=1490288 RepID=A0ABW0EVL8_9PSEU
MVRQKDPLVRALLVNRAAHLLGARSPVTLRSLVAGTGVSTMAVYTHFGGIDGLWSAVRQEGFTRLAAALDALPTTRDPVHDLAALGVAYLTTAEANPDLYRTMFDTHAPLDDPAAADATLARLTTAAARATSAARFHPDTDPAALATRTWIIGHGLASLTTTGPLPRTALTHAVPLLTALFTSAGDTPTRATRSVRRAYRDLLSDR